MNIHNIARADITGYVMIKQRERESLKRTAYSVGPTRTDYESGLLKSDMQ